MRRILFWGSAALTAVVLGLGTALLAVMITGLRGDGGSVGPWVTRDTTGSPDAGPYVRATTAIYALLALNRKETIYYNTVTDSGGKVLSGDCTYRLTGRDLPARWWSITAYGADAHLIENSAHRYSISQTTVERDADGSYVAIVSPRPHERNWLPVKAGRRFELTARFYNPEPGVEKGEGVNALPIILRESCS